MDRSPADIEAMIKRFLDKENLLPKESPPLPGDTDLIEAKVLDSLSLVKLVVFIEGELGARIPQEDITPANFGSVQAMASYLASFPELYSKER